MGLRIGIDATPIGSALTEKGGMRKTLYDLVIALSETDQTNEYVLLFNFFRRRNKADFERIRELFSKRQNFSLRLTPIPNRLMHVLPMPISLLAGAVDVFHFPSHQTYPVWGARSVVTIHDLRALTVDNRYNRQWARVVRDDPRGAKLLQDYRWIVRYYERLSRRLPKVICRSDLIIVPSQFTKICILERFKISESRIRVIPWGISGSFHPARNGSERRHRLRDFGVDSKFLLTVGRLDPQKNLLRLVDAFARLKRELHFEHKLVIAGSRTWFEPILRRHIHEQGLAKEILLVGFVADEDLRDFYTEAEVFVFPSLFEGFGIPPLEAMVSGCPVVASRAAAIPETVGKAALLVDPYSVDSIAEGVYSVLSDPERQKVLRERGMERVRRFSWEHAARKTIDAYVDARITA